MSKREKEVKREREGRPSIMAPIKKDDQFQSV